MWPVKIVPNMTYNVFDGTLNPTLPTYLHSWRRFELPECFLEWHVTVLFAAVVDARTAGIAVSVDHSRRTDLESDVVQPEALY